MNAANDTRGHSAANPGLRGHSCGDNYPLTISGSPSGWRVFNCKTGVESRPFCSYQDAAKEMAWLRNQAKVAYWLHLWLGAPK